MNDIRVLDCTLRDGGYINDWKFGKRIIQNIIESLDEAKVDLIEVGFLRDCESDSEYSIYNTIEELKGMLPAKLNHAEYVAMILHSNYDINKLEKCDGTVPYIRVTFHDYDIEEGISFCRAVKEKGYKLFVNPINLMGYSDDKLLELINKINLLHPYGFSIVDTFGSMSKRDLVRVYAICEHNLRKDIVLGLHLHENMSLAFSLAQCFLEFKESGRQCVIDGSLNGMGRVPGNLCIELIVDYLNQYFNKSYSLDSILDAIENYIMPIKKRTSWGYSTEYFLSAKNNMHRNYAEFFLAKGRLTTRAINELLEKIPEDKKSKFDAELAQKLFIAYQDIAVNDTEAKSYLRKYFEGREVLALAPGNSLDSNQDMIIRFMKEKNPVVICAGFVYEKSEKQICFFSNEKRYQEYKNENSLKIITSNIKRNRGEKNVINYRSLAFSGDELFDNCGIMLLKMLKMLGIEEINLAGFDGFSENGKNYAQGYHGEFVIGTKDDNYKIAREIEEIGKSVKLNFLTPTNYIL